MPQLPTTRSEAVAISFLLVASGVAVALSTVGWSVGETPSGMPFQTNSAGRASSGFFYQTVTNGMSPNQFSALTSPNGESVQSPTPPGSEGTSQIGLGGDVYFFREGEGYLFLSQPTLEVTPPTQSLLAQVLEVWKDPAKRRSRFRIYVEILELLREQPLNPFEVAFKLRLNVKRTRRYLEFLEKSGVLERVEEGSKVRYRISHEGVALLEGARRALMLDRYR